MEPDPTTRLTDIIGELTGRINWYRTTLGDLQLRHDILQAENTELRIINREQRTGRTLQTLEAVTNHLHQVWAWIQSPTGPDPEYDRLADQFQQLCETGTIPNKPTIHITVNHTEAAKQIRKNL